MRLACLQHVAFEGPGAIGEWAAARGHEMRIVRLDEGEALPRPEDFDALAVMGGPMSVHDEGEYAWLRPEKRLVSEALERGRFVLGICLGSQLLAEGLGGRVYRNRVKEIGWFPIRLRAEAAHSALFGGLPGEMPVLHWHGETYDPPPGCAHLAGSEGCAVQAYEHETALGLQFHFEVTREGLRELIVHGGQEIGTGPYEQRPEEIAAGWDDYAGTARSTLFEILDRIEGKIAGDQGQAPDGRAVRD